MQISRNMWEATAPPYRRPGYICTLQEDGDEMSSGEIPKETDEEEIIDVGALNEVQEQVFEDAETLGPSR